MKLETQSACKDHILILIEKALKQIGAGVGVRCENRSLDELNDDLLSRRGDGEGTARLSDGTIDCLQPLYDTFIGPIEDLLLGDEIVIVPDGPLCLVPWAALSETIRIRTVPLLTVLTLITNSPEGYHSKRGALLVGDPCLKKVTSRSGKPVYAELYYARKEVATNRKRSYQARGARTNHFSCINSHCSSREEGNRGNCFGPKSWVYDRGS